MLLFTQEEDPERWVSWFITRSWIHGEYIYSFEVGTKHRGWVIKPSHFGFNHQVLVFRWFKCSIKIRGLFISIGMYMGIWPCPHLANGYGDPIGFERIMYISHVCTGMSIENKHSCLHIYIHICFKNMEMVLTS